MKIVDDPYRHNKEQSLAMLSRAQCIERTLPDAGSASAFALNTFRLRVWSRMVHDFLRESSRQHVHGAVRA
jgi:hypothetical protein